MGFGEAGVPVVPVLRYALAAATHRNGYGPVAGTEALRDATAGYWIRRGLPTTADDVVCGPGSKALLFGLLLSLRAPTGGRPVDLAISRPSWVSYAAQASLTGIRPVHIPVPRGANGSPGPGGVPDPELLSAAAGKAAAQGRRIGAVIVTLPDNPTGTLAGAETVTALCEVARQHDMLIISDEIYRDLVFAGPRAYTSPAEIAPERTVITSGLSKNLALGGWRLGVARIPGRASGGDPVLGALRTRLLATGSEIWSAPAAPVQEAAALAFSEIPDITERIKVSRRLHGAIARAVAARFTAAGALVAPPQGAFYLYPDFGPHREALFGRYGVRTWPRSCSTAAASGYCPAAPSATRPRNCGCGWRPPSCTATSPRSRKPRWPPAPPPLCRGSLRSWTTWPRPWPTWSAEGQGRAGTRGFCRMGVRPPKSLPDRGLPTGPARLRRWPRPRHSRKPGPA
jgi:aspartate aminotransferase